MVPLHVRENSNKEGWRFAIVGVIPSSRLAKLGEKERLDFQSLFIVLRKINRLQEERNTIHRIIFDSRVKLKNKTGSGAVQLMDIICMHISMLLEWNFCTGYMKKHNKSHIQAIVLNKEKDNLLISSSIVQRKLPNFHNSSSSLPSFAVTWKHNHHAHLGVVEKLLAVYFV